MELDDAIEHLYGADLEVFVAERTRLAKELRADGRRAEATQVAELRKPSLPVWAVNQLARRRRKEVDLLLDAGHRLVAAQKGLLGGGGHEAFDRAREREQAALKRLRESARTILGERASAAMLERVISTLRAAAVSDEAREELARGRLANELAPTGFEAFAGTAVAPAQRGGTAKPRSERADRTSERKEALARARASLTAAREREAALAKQLREAERSVGAARQELDAAERDAERLRREREAAASDVETARKELDAARRDAKT